MFMYALSAQMVVPTAPSAVGRSICCGGNFCTSAAALNPKDDSGVSGLVVFFLFYASMQHDCLQWGKCLLAFWGFVEGATWHLSCIPAKRKREKNF